MPGFSGTKTALTICHVEEPKSFDIEALRKGAFNEAITPQGTRYGWTGLGDVLDFDNFFLAGCDSRFHGFSFRIDARKPSDAVIRLQLAELIKSELEQGRKVGSARRKELRQAITEKLTSQAEFVPLLVDCIWDKQENNLYLGTVSEKAISAILEHFKGCFHMDARVLEPQKDMPHIFSTLQEANHLDAGGDILQPMGSANLAAIADEGEKSAIAVQNSAEAVSEALNQGMVIKKIALTATRAGNDDEPLFFTLDTGLLVSALTLPKPEKGAEEEATFLLNAAIIASTAEIIKEISQ